MWEGRKAETETDTHISSQGTEYVGFEDNHTVDPEGGTGGSSAGQRDHRFNTRSCRGNRQRRPNRCTMNRRRTQAEPTSVEHPIDLIDKPTTANAPPPFTLATNTTAMVQHPPTNQHFDLTGSDNEDSNILHLKDHAIPKTWVLLDNYSTVNVFRTPTFFRTSVL